MANSNKSSSYAKRPSNLGGFIQVDKETLNEIDYLDKLSPQDRAWYERFLDNEYNARFHKDGKDVVMQKTKEGRAANAYKQRRLYDFTNKLFKYSDPLNPGIQLLVPKPKLPPTKRIKKPTYKLPLRPPNNEPKFESLNEFLSRGGNITKLKDANTLAIAEKSNKVINSLLTLLSLLSILKIHEPLEKSVCGIQRGTQV